ERLLDHAGILELLLVHEPRTTQRVVEAVDRVLAVLAPHERQHAQQRRGATVLPVDRLVLALVDLFQAEQLPVHLDGAHLTHFPDPIRAAPGPRSARVEVEGDRLGRPRAPRARSRLGLRHRALSSARHFLAGGPPEPAPGAGTSPTAHSIARQHDKTTSRTAA